MKSIDQRVADLERAVASRSMVAAVIYCAGPPGLSAQQLLEEACQRAGLRLEEVPVRIEFIGLLTESKVVLLC